MPVSTPSKQSHTGNDGGSSTPSTMKEKSVHTYASAFDSVTESCFLVLPKSGNNKTALNDPIYKRQRAAAGDIDQFEYNGFRKLFLGNESLESMKYRHDKYQQMWEKTEKQIHSVVVDINTKMLSDIQGFVNTAYEQSDLIPDYIQLPKNEIPTGIIFSGINLADHRILYDQLVKNITNQQQKQHHHVARLESKDCTSIKNMMKNCIEQFLGGACAMGDDDMETEESAGMESSSTNAADILLFSRSKKGQSRLPPYDMTILAGWYEHIVNMNRDFDGRRKGDESEGDACAKKPNLVVLIEDFECFDPTVLCDFITICNIYQERLPFVFLFSLATTIESLHQALPRTIVTLLRTEQFSLVKPDTACNTIIEQVMLAENTGLRLNVIAYDNWVKSFKLSHLSLTKLKKGLQYAYMDYFYSNPFSIFLGVDVDNDEEWNKVMELVSDQHIDSLLMLPSFKTHVERSVIFYKQKAAKEESDKINKGKDNKEEKSDSDDEDEKSDISTDSCMDESSFLTPEQIRKLLTDKTEFMTYFRASLKELRVFHIRQYCGIVISLYLQSVLRSKLFSKDLSLVLKFVFEGTVYTEWLKKIVQVFSKFVPGDLCQFIELARQVFSEYAEYFPKELEALHEFHKELVALFTDDELDFGEAMEMFHKASKQGRSKRDNEVELDDYYVRLAIKHGLFNQGTRQTNSSRRAQKTDVFMELSSTRGGIKDQEYEYLPISISNWLDPLLQDLLSKSYTYMPFYEIYYYKNSQMLDKGFRPQPRACVQSALSNPVGYLSLGSSSKSGIDPLSHDSTIAYKLYLECGRLINLYDWFSAFKAILECEGDYANEAIAEFKEENGEADGEAEKQGNDKEASGKGKEKSGDEELDQVEDLVRNKFAQARFIRAVGELQFLGFVKPTQKKTDHVMRLTWGSV